MGRPTRIAALGKPARALSRDRSRSGRPHRSRTGRPRLIGGRRQGATGLGARGSLPRERPRRFAGGSALSLLIAVGYAFSSPPEIAPGSPAVEKVTRLPRAFSPLSSSSNPRANPRIRWRSDSLAETRISRSAMRGLFNGRLDFSYALAEFPVLPFTASLIAGER